MRRETFENILRWGFRLWNWFGIEVRISLFLVIFIAFGLFDFIGQQGVGGGLIYWASASLFLFSIILLHEYGHCFAGRAVGGSADRIIMWPLGGLALVDAPQRPSSQLVVAVGGPLVNVAFLILLSPYMIWGQGHFSSYILRIGLDGGAGGVHWYLSTFFAINLDLLLFNLIPAFPMDGGRILHCLLWPRLGLLKATQVTVVVAKVAAVLMVIAGAGLFFTGVKGGLLLSAIGIMVWFASTQQLQLVQGGMFGGDQWGDPYSFEGPPEGGGVSGWWAKRREAKRLEREERTSRREFDRRQRVDELLEKVHQEGITSLSDGERKFLKEASQHYKN